MAAANNNVSEIVEEETCLICIEPTPDEKRFDGNGGCSHHPLCTDCVIQYIRVKIEDDNAGRIPCPSLGCDRTLDPLACASLVGPSLFARWCDVLCEEAIIGLSRRYCPDRDCNALVVNECGGAGGESKCPQCKGRFCFECGRTSHPGVACDGEDGDDVAFARLAETEKWKRCPRCSHFVQKVDGCRFIKCRCGIRFCYRCGKQVQGHWCPCEDTDIDDGMQRWTWVWICIFAFVCGGILFLWSTLGRGRG